MDFYKGYNLKVYELYKFRKVYNTLNVTKLCLQNTLVTGFILDMTHKPSIILSILRHSEHHSTSCPSITPSYNSY